MTEFEWDLNKQKFNLQKHLIDFVDAIRIFGDLNRIEYPIQYGNEIRYITIGIVDTIILFVVYTNRGRKKRIISARRAKQKERKKYEDSAWQNRLG